MKRPDPLAGSGRFFMGPIMFVEINQALEKIRNGGWISRSEWPDSAGIRPSEADLSESDRATARGRTKLGSPERDSQPREVRRHKGPQVIAQRNAIQEGMLVDTSLAALGFQIRWAYGPWRVKISRHCPLVFWFR